MGGIAAAHSLMGAAVSAMTEVRNISIISQRVMSGKLPEEVREEFRLARDALGAVGTTARIREMVSHMAKHQIYRLYHINCS